MSGPNPNKPCVFPFQYHGMTFNNCTNYDGADNKAWCATKVDGSGNHFYGGDEYDQENWGNCGPNCPISGKSLHLKKANSQNIFPILVPCLLTMEPGPLQVAF